MNNSAPDENIDFSDIPETTPEQWKDAVRGKFYRAPEGRITIRDLTDKDYELLLLCVGIAGGSMDHFPTRLAMLTLADTISGGNPRWDPMNLEAGDADIAALTRYLEYRRLESGMR